MTLLFFLLFNSYFCLQRRKTDQLFNWVRSDVKELSEKCNELRGSEQNIYPYQEQHEDFIAKFLGDFLTYSLPTQKIGIVKWIIRRARLRRERLIIHWEGSSIKNIKEIYNLTLAKRHI